MERRDGQCRGPSTRQLLAIGQTTLGRRPLRSTDRDSPSNARRHLPRAAGYPVSGTCRRPLSTMNMVLALGTRSQQEAISAVFRPRGRSPLMEIVAYEVLWAAIRRPAIRTPRACLHVPIVRGKPSNPDAKHGPGTTLKSLDHMLGPSSELPVDATVEVTKRLEVGLYGRDLRGFGQAQPEP